MKSYKEFINEKEDKKEDKEIDKEKYISGLNSFVSAYKTALNLEEKPFAKTIKKQINSLIKKKSLGNSDAVKDIIKKMSEIDK